MAKNIIYLTILILFSTSLFSKSLEEYPRRRRPYVKKQRCVYKDYSAKAVVVSIEKTENSKAQKSELAYEGVEIHFVIKPKDEIENKKVLNTPYIFLLNDGTYPGMRYVKKYNIEIGSSYDGDLRVLKRGHSGCKDVVFKTYALQGDDYFERKNKIVVDPDPIYIDPPIVAKKPILYLYPEKSQKVEVKVKNSEKLTHTYPKYNNGWSVIAHTDGMLIDPKTGREYYSLYWEAEDNYKYNMDKGFVVKGEDSAKFLEKKLSQLGLTDREANEFIIYWLPILEKNSYNLIHFSTEEYSNRFPLDIKPAPDSLIRVFMVYKPLKESIDIEPQIFKTPKRTGFTVVEWGGGELK